MYEELTIEMASDLKIDIVGLNSKFSISELTKEINNGGTSQICQPGTGIYNSRCHDENGKFYGGTFGAIIIDKEYKPVILSNWHVLPINGPIYFYKESYRSKKIEKQFIISWLFKGINFPVAMKLPIEPEEGMKVIKSGFTTDKTTGVIEKIGIEEDIKIPIYIDGIKMDDKYHFKDTIKISGDKEKFADHGDSGSILLTENDFDPVGLIFAGSPNNNITYACKMSHIFKIMNLKGIICPTKKPLYFDIKTTIEKTLQRYRGSWHPV